MAEEEKSNDVNGSSEGSAMHLEQDYSCDNCGEEQIDDAYAEGQTLLYVTLTWLLTVPLTHLANYTF